MKLELTRRWEGVLGLLASALGILAAIHGWVWFFDRFYLIRGALLAVLVLMVFRAFLSKRYLRLLWPLLILFLGWAPPSALFAWYWYRHQESEWESRQDRALDEVLKLASLELKRHERPYEMIGTVTVRGTGNRLFLFFENRRVIWSRIYDVQNVMIFMPLEGGKTGVWRNNERVEPLLRRLAGDRDRKTRDELVAYLVRQLSLPPER